MIRPAFLIVACFPLQAPLAAAPPTVEDQYFLELVNRARANPDAEVARLMGGDWENSPDLNEGLTPGTISNEPKPPLAFDPRLNDAALMHSVTINTNVLRASTGPGAPRILPEGIVIEPAKIAPTFELRAKHENFQASHGAVFGEHFHQATLTNARSTGALIFRPDIEDLHEIIFVDRGNADRSRRVRLLDSSWNLLGLSFRGVGGFYPNAGVSSFSVLVTESFVSEPGSLFVTGVVFHDFNDNDFYDMNESAGSLELIITTVSGVVLAKTRTFRSGGYTVPFKGRSPGNYLVTVRDSFGGAATVPFTWGNTKNVKVDIIDPDLTSLIVVDSPHFVDGFGGFSPGRVSGMWQSGPQYIRENARTRRPLIAKVSYINRGYSKVRTNVLFYQRYPSSFKFRLSGKMLYRGEISAIGSGKAFIPTDLDLQTREQVSFVIKIFPVKRKRSKRRSTTLFYLSVTPRAYEEKYDIFFIRVTDRLAL